MLNDSAVFKQLQEHKDRHRRSSWTRGWEMNLSHNKSQMCEPVWIFLKEGSQDRNVQMGTFKNHVWNEMENWQDHNQDTDGSSFTVQKSVDLNLSFGHQYLLRRYSSEGFDFAQLNIYIYPSSLETVWCLWLIIYINVRLLFPLRIDLKGIG